MASGNKVTKLELRLVDGLSGPAKAAARSIGRLNKAFSSIKGTSFGGPSMRGAVDAVGRRSSIRDAARATGVFEGSGRGLRRAAGETAALSGAATVGVVGVFRQNYELEKQLNIAMAAGNLNLAQRGALMDEAVKLNPKFAATNAEIVGGANELLKAGMSYDQTVGSLEAILNASQAMDSTTIADAAAGITDNMIAMRMPMKTLDESFRSSTKLADLFAQAVGATNASFEDYTVSSKYFAPVAAAFKMSAEEAVAWQTVLAKGGIKGSSAGTGLRAAPISIAAPTKKGREAFARLGIDPSRYTGAPGGAATGASITAALEAAGLSTEGLEAGIDKLIASGRFKNAPKKLAAAIVAQFSDDLGAATAEDRSLIADSVNRALAAGTTSIDMYGVLKAMRDKGASPADYKNVFGGNHASKLMGVQIELYEQILDLMKNATGRAKTMREAMQFGIVGDMNEMTAAVEKMSIAFGKSGLLSDAAKGIEALSVAMNRMTEFNPALLRMAGYATVAVAALAPLGFALSGVAAIAGLVASPVGIAAAAIGTLAVINLKPIANGLRSLRDGFRSALDPKILAGLGGMKVRIGDLVASLKLPDHALDGAAGQLGRLAAGLANDAAKLGPVLADYGERLRSFGSAAIAANLPAITAGLDSFRVAITGFVGTKVDALVGLGGSLASFMETTVPKFTPAAASAVTLFAASFRTLSAGFQAVGQFVGAATTGLASFARSFIENIDPAAMQMIANGLKAALDSITVPVRALGDAYASIGRSITGASGSIDSFAATAGASMARGFNVIVDTLSSIGSYVPDFSGIIGAVSSFVSTIAGLVERLAAAIQRMKDVVASMPSAGSLAGALGGVGLSTVPTPQRGNLIRDALAGTPLPRKAAGGLVRGGRSYLVGERGPEIFNPGRTGNVTPNHRLGGGGDTNIFNINSTDPKGAADEVMRKWSQRMARSNQISMDGRNNR